MDSLHSARQAHKPVSPAVSASPALDVANPVDGLARIGANHAADVDTTGDRPAMRPRLAAALAPAGGVS